MRSVVRQTLYGADNPTYTGQMVWRSLLKGSDVPEDVMEPMGHTQWVGPGCHFIAYYIRQKKFVNIVTQEDTDKWVEEGWSTRGDPDEMRLSFPNPEPRLAKLLSLVTECSKWGLFTRPLTQNWGRGRIQLIGDAAHAMLPNAGQGACQAFEDAYMLGRWLEAMPRSGRGLCQFPPCPHPARAWGAAALDLQCALQAHARQAASRRSRSAPAQAASTATPTGSGVTIRSANGTRSLLFPPSMRPDSKPCASELTRHRACELAAMAGADQC